MLCVFPLQAKKTKYVTLKPDDFKVKIEQTVNPCVIDVRSAGDFEFGHISGAINLNHNELQFISELKRQCSNTDDPIFVYCNLGKTSKLAAQKIVENGFTNVYNLKGGVMAWRKKFSLVTE